MKPLALLIPAAAAAALPSDTRTLTFVPVALPEPHNWDAGLRLFPGSVMAGYNANMSDYTAESWAKFVLDECGRYTDCTSTISFSGINSGSTGGRFWYGYRFRGGPTSAADYVRKEGVEDSVVYSIAAQGESTAS